MNSTTYITPFWVQDVSGSSWSLRLYSRNSGSTHGNLDWTIDVEYSTDGSTWSDFGTTKTSRNSYISKSFSANQKVYLRSKTQCTHWGKYDTSNSRFWYIQIYSNNQYSVGGNIMSLLYGSTFATNRNYTTFPDDTLKGIFFGLFYSSGSTSNTNLIDASELVLPVTHSTSTVPSVFSQDAPLNRCYGYMFYKCTALVGGPHIDLRDRGSYDLPYCFQSMFNYDTSLMSLHINTVGANFRYNSMFSNNACAQGSICYDYSGGPTSSALPTDRMTRQSIISMYLPTYDRVVDWHSDYSGYVNQVDDSNSVTIYKKSEDKSIPFNVTNVTSSTVSMNVQKKSSRYSGGEYEGASSAPTVTIEYSTNDTPWRTWCTTSTTSNTLSIPPYTTYYFRASASRWAYHFYWSASNLETVAYNNITFSGTSSVEIGGNIMSLLYGSNFTGNETSFPNNQYTYTFAYLFGKDSHGGDVYKSIKHAKNLIMPATTLTEAAYMFMFYGNTSLISTPNLPATTLDSICYSDMFRSCSSLIYTTALPATTLAQDCYNSMFYGCTSLEIAPELRALTIPYHNSGVPIQPYIGAYQAMFYGCTSLKHVRCLATSPTNGKGTNVWLGNVSSTGTFIKAAGTTWTTGSDGIPSGWTVVEV